jgi:hypothetical protein
MAVTEWLQLLNQYDENYQKENLANYKSRRIQQQAMAKPGSAPSVKEEPQVRANLEITQSEEKNRLEKSDADKHAYELQILIEHVMLRPSLEDELENLSDTLYDFVDSDDNIIDFFK